MSLNKLNRALQSLRSFFNSAKEKGEQPFWNTISKKFQKISDIAKSADWQSIEDACQIGEDLVKKISSGEIPDDLKAHERLELFFKIFDDLYNDIKSNGQITISVKGQLAKVKMFIGDFVKVLDDPKETSPSEESDFSIDVMHELNNRVATLEHLVLEIKESYIEPEIINGIFREFHTLKGEAGFLGYENLGKFCHQVETVLQPLRDKKVFVTQEIIDILLFFVDKTKLYILNIQNKEVDKDDSDDVNEKVSLLEKFIKEMGDKPTETETLRQAQADITEAKTGEKEKEPSSEFESAFPLDEDEEETESPESSTETVMEQPEEKDIPDTTKIEIEKTKDDIVDAGIKAQKDEQTVFLNVETNKVDSLINITGELTILYQMLQQSPEIRQIADQRITNNIDMMGRFFKELQSIAISIRTVSIQPLFLKMARLARELGRKSNKNIKVSILGEAAQVDKSLINQLAGPLAHIIRNCIDHGIEPPHERIEANKDEMGHIKLEAKKKGNSTLIEISDDGRGIPFSRLESKAKELGLISPNAVLSEKEKYELMFEPGLSTASKVTRTSGRGVGMDVIRSEVKKAKGTLEIKSQEGKGTTISLLFSQTFAITEGLVVRVKRNFFVIPIEQVREMSQYNSEKVKTIKNKSKMVLIRDHYVPLINLESFLKVYPVRDKTPKVPALPSAGISNGIKQNGSNDSNADQTMVAVENEEKLCVLLVDEVIGSQEVVVKELTGSFSDLPYFSGTTILGNKGVGIILDIAKITNAIHSLSAEEKQTVFTRGKDNNRINVVEIGTNKVAMIDFFIETAKEKLSFAINAFKAREFISMDNHKAMPLPKAPNGFEGIITLRGNTLPVLSLAKLLGLETDGSLSKEKIAIVCEFSKKTVGFLVTGVNKVNYISWNEILPPPKTSGKISLKNIVGTILKNGSKAKEKSIKDAREIIFVLDFEKILNDVIPLYDSMEDKIKLKKTRKSKNVVLLVEDSAIMRSKMKKALESGGITVVEAENGQEALDIVNKYFHQCKENNGTIFDFLDLILSDIEMPQLDGYTLAKTIKSHPELRMLPVLLHSSLSNETIVQRAKEVHADGFVSKCDPETLLKFLQKYL